MRFPAGYRADFLPRTAIFDIAHIEELSRRKSFGDEFLSSY